MIEWRQLALAHELPRADLDDGDTRCVMEVRNDPFGHMLDPHSPGAPPAPTCTKTDCAVLRSRERGTIAIWAINGQPNRL